MSRAASWAAIWKSAKQPDDRAPEARTFMIIVINGPLGIGKSTLSEALSERIDRCAMLDGDSLVAVNPLPADPVEHLHRGIVLLLRHHRRFGYRHFVINHLWETAAELEDLHRRLARLDDRILCFRMTLDPESNLARIDRRASVRAIDELDYEQETFHREHAVLSGAVGRELGEPWDATAPPEQLADALLREIRHRYPSGGVQVG
jgi:hypothetical protein